MCLAHIYVLNVDEGQCLCRHAGTERRAKRNISWLSAISPHRPLAKLHSVRILEWLPSWWEPRRPVGTQYHCTLTHFLFSFCLYSACSVLLLTASFPHQEPWWCMMVPSWLKVHLHCQIFYLLGSLLDPGTLLIYTVYPLITQGVPTLWISRAYLKWIFQLSLHTVLWCELWYGLEQCVFFSN